MAHTPWGEIKVQDAHVHFFSHAFYEALARQKRVEGAEALAPILHWEIPSRAPESLAARWVAELDRHGVRRAALIATTPCDEKSVVAASASHPGRFYGYFLVDPQQPDACKRLMTASTDPHLHCICLFPSMHKYPICDPKVKTVLEIAKSHHLAVFVHCGALSLGVRKKLGLDSPFDMRYANPLDLHRVALEYPQVQFIVPHLGSGLFREALMLADLCPNVWLDTSSSNHWIKYEGLDLRQVFRRCLDLLGPERILFGTDSSYFPRGWQTCVFEEQTAALHEIGIGREAADLIFGRNLERLHHRRTAAKRSIA
jgi:uncharacterized protein